MSQTPKKQRVWGLDKDQMNNRDIKTADYQRELLQRHKVCQIRHNATSEVLFDSETRRYYVQCDNCLVGGN